MKLEYEKTQVIDNGSAIPKKLGAFVKKLLKRHPLLLLVFSIFVIFQALVEPISAYLLKVIIDGVIATQEQFDLLLTMLLVPAILYVFIHVIKNIVYTVHRYAQLQLYPKMKSDIAGTMHHYLAQHSFRYFGEHFSGSLSKKIFDLCNGVETLIQIMTHAILPQTLAVVISSVILYKVQPLFGVTLFLWAFAYVAASCLMSYRSEKLAYSLSEAGNVMGGKIVDSIINIMSTKLFTNSDYEEKVVFNSIDNLMKKDRALQWYLLKVYFIQGLWVILLISLMLIWLIHYRLHNYVTVGDFALILTLSAAISSNIFNMGEQILRFAKEAGNCRQALNIIVEPHEINDNLYADELEVTEGKIIFENVHFEYQEGTPLFKNKTVIIEPGQKVGLVGNSGSGKSTFANLILRLFDVTSGKILIDGRDIREVTQDSLRKNIGFIPQDPLLFHRTLMENIQYGRVGATFDEVVEAAKQAYAHEFIVNLPQGYDSLVGERGVKLSGGQRQRIAIARAFLKNARILILDEATSQLDSVTEHYIQESLWKLMQNKTTIVIAHRLSTLLHMDRILVFDNGKIVEDGTHAELLGRKGLYHAFWQAQVGGFLLEQEDQSTTTNLI